MNGFNSESQPNIITYYLHSYYQRIKFPLELISLRDMRFQQHLKDKRFSAESFSDSNHDESPPKYPSTYSSTIEK